MLSKNMGSFDRGARVVVGLALLIAFFALPDLGLRWVLLIGIVPLATGLLGSCPAYSIFGVSTCSTK
ncbi:MAG: DUF2892 domain-containing protein [Boseongicola sp.]|nr:DUF2892 domain-containing protein [Boseongicola sp.]